MKRAILSAPATFTEADLTAEQAQAIAGIRAEWVLPMPGTVAAGGLRLIDAVMFDSFDPENIAVLGLPFTVLGLWQWSGAGAMAEVTALDVEAFQAHLPADLHEPHRWAGWPAAF